MSDTVAETLLPPALEDEWRDDIVRSETIFTAIWQGAQLLKGRVMLRDGSQIDVAKRERPEGGSVMVVTHEYAEPDITATGALVELPKATKYVIDTCANADASFTDMVSEKTFDLSEEKNKISERTYYDCDDAVEEFIRPFVDKELGRKAHKEKLWQLTQYIAQLKSARDHDLPPRPEKVLATQLTTAHHLRNLLEQAMDVFATQVARAQVAREYDE